VPLDAGRVSKVVTVPADPSVPGSSHQYAPIFHEIFKNKEFWLFCFVSSCLLFLRLISSERKIKSKLENSTHWYFLVFERFAMLCADGCVQVLLWSSEILSNNT
jgi:hypothetical protein